MPAWSRALKKLYSGPLFQLAGSYSVTVRCDERYPIAKTDWAYVSNDGDIYLNPRREASVGEWEYIISHRLLHLGFEHFRKDRMGDPAWIAACDLTVTRFLRDSRIGTPPSEFLREFPLPIKDEEQTYQQLLDAPVPIGSFSTMTNGRPDMIWVKDNARNDYACLLAQSLQETIQNSLRAVQGLPPPMWDFDRPYQEARDWFLSNFPLLGAVASAFRIVDDRETVRRLDISVAAVSPPDAGALH